MGWWADFKEDLKSNFEFEKFQLEDMWRDIKENPERLFIGAIETGSTDMWNSILGTDYEPLVNQFGGATNARFVEASERGIDTEPAQFLHGVAKDIAKSYAAAGVGGAAGNYAGSQGASAGAQQGISEGVTQGVGGGMSIPPPSEFDPDLAHEFGPEGESQQKRYMPSFGPKAAGRSQVTPGAGGQPLYIPGVGMVDPATYQQIQPTFGSV